jgi:hypothetical protein
VQSAFKKGGDKVKRREEVVGISLACLFILAMVIQATFGGAIDLSIVPSPKEVVVGSTCTYTITVFSYEGNWFDVTIEPHGDCDKSWFEWTEIKQVRIDAGEEKRILLNVTPSEEGEFGFDVKAEAVLDERTSSGPRPTWIRAKALEPPQHPPTCIELMPNLPEPQRITTENGTRQILWTAFACYSPGYVIEYRFRLKGPRTNYTPDIVQNWSRSNVWAWVANASDIGNSTIYADVRDRYPDSTSHDYDDSCEYKDYAFILKPCCACLMPDKSEPQPCGTAINWTACANYPDQDSLRYRFWVHDGGWNVTRDWDIRNIWTWTPADPGDYDVMVQIIAGNLSVDNGTYWAYNITASAQKPMAF